MNSQRLEFIRAQMKLSKAQFARDLGVHPQTYLKWSRGESHMTASAVRLVYVLYALRNRSPHIYNQVLEWGQEYHSRDQVEHI